jgi:putative glutamine amidotransferase
MDHRPRIVVTLHGPEQAAREEPTWASFEPYLDAVRRAGGEPVPLDPTTSDPERAAALDAMDGLLLPGGADLDPALYGEEAHPSVMVEAARDDLERAAWAAARARRVPIFGVCRGFQAINVFSGERSRSTWRVTTASPMRRSRIRCTSIPPRAWRRSSATPTHCCGPR